MGYLKRPAGQTIIEYQYRAIKSTYPLILLREKFLIWMKNAGKMINTVE